MTFSAENIATNADLGPIGEGVVGTVVFDIFTPVPMDGLRANIVAALARKLPEAYADARAIRIVAGGPSARQAPLDGPTLALNGALKLFTDRGLAPTYWACCDPQGLLVEKFLTGELPKETIYLVASKCPPNVFDRLKDRDVRVWHVSDVVGEPDEDGHIQFPGLFPVPCGTTITTCAIALMLKLGYARQEIWGWDCCFGEDGATHANPQEHFFHEVIDLDVDGRMFKTTRSWALEAIDLGNKVWPVFEWLGLDIKVMGDGMVKAFLAGSKAKMA